MPAVSPSGSMLEARAELVSQHNNKKTCWKQERGRRNGQEESEKRCGDDAAMPFLKIRSKEEGKIKEKKGKGWKGLLLHNDLLGTFWVAGGDGNRQKKRGERETWGEVGPVTDRHEVLCTFNYAWQQGCHQVQSTTHPPKSSSPPPC